MRAVECEKAGPTAGLHHLSTHTRESRARRATSARHQRSAALVLFVLDTILYVLLHVAVRRLRRTADFLGHSFDLLLIAADGLARGLLDFSSGFLNSPLDLIFIDTHENNPPISMTSTTPIWHPIRFEPVGDPVDWSWETRAWP
jgi:hypothetical protein